MKNIWKVLCCSLLLCPVFCGAMYLPIYIEDNHGGSFYFFAETLDWEKKYHLLLFDTHSDATAVIGSDYIRQKLCAYKNSAKNDLLGEWRDERVIQCYNWIEPLVPELFTQVSWIYPEKSDHPARSVLLEQAAVQLNSYQDIKARAEKDLSTHYRVTPFSELPAPCDYSSPVVASIDLDYFVAMSTKEAEAEFENILAYLLQIRELKALSIAISRPYLTSDEQSYRLLYMTLKSLGEIVNARIQFEPYISYPNDNSELAREYARNNKAVPRFQVEKLPDYLKNLIVQRASHIKVTVHPGRWKSLLKKWQEEVNSPVISINGHSGEYIAGPDSAMEVKLDAEKDDWIRWYVIEADNCAYNIMGNTGYALSSPRFIRFKQNLLPAYNGKGKLKKSQLLPLFDKGNGLGTIRLVAEVSGENGVYRSNELRISRRSASTYPGILTELCNLPYVFGSFTLHDGDMQSAEAYYGAECSSFLIYGFRRQGKKMLYGDPKFFKMYLDLYSEVSGFDYGIAVKDSKRIRITKGLIDKGLIFHFGRHVAALYQDTEPLGVLDKSDLVIHQLENYPEIVELGKLPQSEKPFSLMICKSP